MPKKMLNILTSWRRRAFAWGGEMFFAAREDRGESREEGGGMKEGLVRRDS
jgi:hypothetical protein